MTIANVVIDGYEPKARLYPALLLIAPVIAAGVAMLSAKIVGSPIARSGDCRMRRRILADAARTRFWERTGKRLCSRSGEGCHPSRSFGTETRAWIQLLRRDTTRS